MVRQSCCQLFPYKVTAIWIQTIIILHENEERIKSSLHIKYDVNDKINSEWQICTISRHLVFNGFSFDILRSRPEVVFRFVKMMTIKQYNTRLNISLWEQNKK